MKNFKFYLLLIALFAFTIGMTSCGGDGNHSHENMENHEAGPDGDHHEGEAEEHTYACPMHPEITGKDGDKCSKCGMDLKMVEEDDHEGHDH